MVFLEKDLPPIFPPGVPKYDIEKEGGNVTQVLTKVELKVAHELKDFNIDSKVDKLKIRATWVGIQLTETIRKIEEEYVKKPKGTAQVLYE